jgi:hypothetical protein
MHVLKTPKFRKCAKKYGELLRSYGGVDKVLNPIEKVQINFFIL